MELYNSKVESISKRVHEAICDIIRELSTMIVLERDSNFLGDAFEYLIHMFLYNSQTIQRQFYTPSEVSDMMVRISMIGKENEKNVFVYDGSLGSGILLFSIFKHIGNTHNLCYYGQEYNDSTVYDIARINMILHGIPMNKVNLHMTTSLNENWPSSVENSLKFDVVLMNPPFSMKWTPEKQFLQDPRFSTYECLAPKSNADFAFILHGLYYLKETGTMAIIVPYGVLTRGGVEHKIRKKLLDKGAIYAVISMPDRIFYNTATATTILVLKKNTKLKDVLFIDASREFKKVKNRNVLTENCIQKIVDTYTKRRCFDKYAYLASYEEIKEMTIILIYIIILICFQI
ncbi:type I restriction-modification system subunit M [Candidatus Stoquefichus sp. SB1]|uniref:type I restriction-modification system subunit M n=1 Tax=Candidatus Stoquefichus sp. SB1 TaxID=1658109 RepID=UPI0026F4654B|nr:type I restriction-modification system subunit M [Candidatus Stoquefichus sp. SB1]